MLLRVQRWVIFVFCGASQCVPGCQTTLSLDSVPDYFIQSIGVTVGVAGGFALFCVVLVYTCILPSLYPTILYMYFKRLYYDKKWFFRVSSPSLIISFTIILNAWDLCLRIYACETINVLSWMSFPNAAWHISR